MMVNSNKLAPAPHISSTVFTLVMPPHRFSSDAGPRPPLSAPLPPLLLPRLRHGATFTAGRRVGGASARHGWRRRCGSGRAAATWWTAGGQAWRTHGGRADWRRDLAPARSGWQPAGVRAISSAIVATVSTRTSIGSASATKVSTSPTAPPAPQFQAMPLDLKPGQVKHLPGGRVKTKERQEVVIEKIVRSKRKCITLVKEFELLGVKLSDSKKVGKKFATGDCLVCKKICDC